MKMNEETLRLETLLRERFGEPIKSVTATVGISDDRSGKVTTDGDESDEDETTLE